MSCKHMDDEGFCTSGNSAGARCCNCAGYEEGETAPVVADESMAKVITEAFERVEATKRHLISDILRFGGLLLRWEAYLGKHPGRGNDGEGLKGWIERNCPTVKYGTAAVYKMMAARSAAMIGSGSQAVAAICGETTVTTPGGAVVDVDARIIRKRDELFEKAQSRRQLEQMWLNFEQSVISGGKEKEKGRPAGTGKKEYDFKKDTPEVEAKRIWTELKLNLESAVLRDSIEHLEPRMALVMVGVLEGLTKKLKERARLG